MAEIMHTVKHKKDQWRAKPPLHKQEHLAEAQECGISAGALKFYAGFSSAVLSAQHSIYTYLYPFLPHLLPHSSSCEEHRGELFFLHMLSRVIILRSISDPPRRQESAMGNSNFPESVWC